MMDDKHNSVSLPNNSVAGIVLLEETQRELEAARADNAALVEALEALAGFPAVVGMAAHIHDSAKRMGIPNPLQGASDALRLPHPGETHTQAHAAISRALELAMADVEKLREALMKTTNAIEEHGHDTPAWRAVIAANRRLLSSAHPGREGG